ncbi:bacterio-opsin activator-like protein [Haloferax mucosum ATCC BAA-1512]|uniref:Bacterio-opsin activator-like protein n=1 Tax=Haloferax mucosum ATCC BAA-1512 TaxID=662479 RepID=M0IDF0_9EURY|nr:DNA-binding protein [Haloferax mucosum]ELZ94786.1 bacterio-opsin activator-like protein [Haloferax mucosum ATCC BAA-1512]
MPAGIRATVEFDTPSVCQIASIAHAADSAVNTVSRSVVADSDTASVSEFVVETEDPPDDTSLDPIFSYGSKHLYRFSHDDPTGCPCECLGEFGCPVDRYFAYQGTLTLVFHAADYEQLQDVIGELRERFPGTDIKRLVRSPTSDAPGDSIFVDRSKLTTRQLEVIQTAYEMGYFERPRGANATEVAAALDINQSTFSEHLAAALTKLLGDILEAR